MQRLLSNVSTLQFVIAYTELGGHATPWPPCPSVVRNLVPDRGKLLPVQRLLFNPERLLSVHDQSLDDPADFVGKRSLRQVHVAQECSVARIALKIL
jgi:hypothetical protein